MAVSRGQRQAATLRLPRTDGGGSVIPCAVAFGARENKGCSSVCSRLLAHGALGDRTHRSASKKN
jgi:hypothetical protein